MMRKEIKGLHYLIQWGIVDIGQIYTVACPFIFCNVTFNQSIIENHFRYTICAGAEKIA